MPLGVDRPGRIRRSVLRLLRVPTPRHSTRQPCPFTHKQSTSLLSDFPNARRLCALVTNTSAEPEHRWVKTTASHVNMCSHLAQNQIWASRIARSHLLHGHGFRSLKVHSGGMVPEEGVEPTRY